MFTVKRAGFLFLMLYRLQILADLRIWESVMELFAAKHSHKKRQPGVGLPKLQDHLSNHVFLSGGALRRNNILSRQCLVVGALNYVKFRGEEKKH